MSIPFYFFLIAYLIALVTIVVFVFFNLYHMFRFGFQDIQSRVMTAVFGLALILILVISTYFVFKIDWSLELTIGIF